jgi:uncharacterized membrane protein
MVLVGVMVLAIATGLDGYGGSASFGAIIFIGPFPIAIGSDPETTWTVLFALILAVLSIIMLFVTRWEMKKVSA